MGKIPLPCKLGEFLGDELQSIVTYNLFWTPIPRKVAFVLQNDGFRAAVWQLVELKEVAVVI